MRIIAIILAVVGAGTLYEVLKARSAPKTASQISPTPSPSDFTLDLNGVPVATVQPNFEAAWATLLPQFQAVPVEPAIGRAADPSETIA